MKASVVVLFFIAVALATLEVKADESLLDKIKKVTVQSSEPLLDPVYVAIFKSKEDAEATAASVSASVLPSKVMKAQVTLESGGGGVVVGGDSDEKIVVENESENVDVDDGVGDGGVGDVLDVHEIAANNGQHARHPKGIWIAAGLFGLTIFLTAATALIIRNLQKKACDKKTSLSNKP